MASERARQAGLTGHRKGLRGSGARTTAAASCATMDQAPCSEQFAHGIFPDPGAILPTGFPERECQVYWHNRSPDGLLEGHIFTDGSSSGSGALRRAGWAVVAVDDAGNLNAAAYGAVPSDVLPGQSARLRCGHGGSVHFGSAYALHRLRRYHCNK